MMTMHPGVPTTFASPSPSRCEKSPTGAAQSQQEIHDAATAAVRLLRDLFGELNCDLRKNSFESFYERFTAIKQSAENVINQNANEKSHLVKNFNAAMRKHSGLQSKDSLLFDVMAVLGSSAPTGEHQIELIFVEV